MITVYNSFGDSPLEHPTIKQFWNILKDFTQDQLSAYLRYVWGRSRLSHSYGDSHKLTYYKGKSNIPEAHTCFFELDLGDYPSEEDLKKKLLYGLENCHIIMETSKKLNLSADFGM
jgi:hypothetical protein